MGLRQAALGLADRLVRPAGLKLVNRGVWDACTQLMGHPPAVFRFGGREYPYFVHHYNCGFPAGYATERTVELALADAWLDRTPAAGVVEVGAVTPYYWPGRVGRVVDPADAHAQVTDRVPMDRVDLTGKDVLCVSTLEHFGRSEYGLPPDDALLHAAVDQLTGQARSLLATVPFGYNPAADALFFADRPPAGLRVGYLARNLPMMSWQEVAVADARRPYSRKYAAGGVAVVEK